MEDNHERKKKIYIKRNKQNKRETRNKKEKREKNRKKCLIKIHLNKNINGQKSNSSRGRKSSGKIENVGKIPTFVITIHNM